jgi:hypothetical protein
MNSLVSSQVDDSIDFSIRGILVRSISDPAKTGRTTGEIMRFAGRSYARLRLKSGEISQVPCDQLERVRDRNPSGCNSRTSAFRSGAFAPIDTHGESERTPYQRVLCAIFSASVQAPTQAGLLLKRAYSNSGGGAPLPFTERSCAQGPTRQKVAMRMHTLYPLALTKAFHGQPLF